MKATDNTDDGMKKIELTEEQVDTLHELALLGLSETDPEERKYGEAYDAFVEEAGYPFRIGDQPEGVREIWDEVVERLPEDPRDDEQ